MRRNVAILGLLIGLFTFIGGPSRTWADDFRTWQRLSLSLWQQEQWEVQLHNETRWRDDSSSLSEQLISPQILWQANKTWRYGLAYTYLRSRKGNGFNNDHRLELEADPHWQLADWVTLDLRNRLEIRFREGEANGAERLRERIQLNFPLKHAGPLQSLYTNNEFFLDLNSHQYNQNRLTPLGVSLQLTDHTHLRLFYLIQSTRSQADWEHAHILGTQLFFRLK